MAFLMLKDEQVATLREENGVPIGLNTIIREELLPICLQYSLSDENFIKWMNSRTMPDNRDGIESVIKRFGSQWKKQRNYFSMTDHYWIKHRSENWRKYNFYDNRYSSVIGDMFFKPWSIDTGKVFLNVNSPDLTTTGIMKKCWRQDVNDSSVSYLIKAGNPNTGQEPLYEILASVFMSNIGAIPTVKYDYSVEGTTLCSKCENFITKNTELIPASYIYFSEPRPENVSTNLHLLRMCEKYQIPDVKQYLAWLSYIDKWTGNKDRNLNNIAFIRDVHQKKFLGPAPVFDNGQAFNNLKNLKSNSFEENTIVGKIPSSMVPQMINVCEKHLAELKEPFENCIMQYPYLAYEYKKELVQTIQKRNVMLMKNIKNSTGNDIVI